MRVGGIFTVKHIRNGNCIGKYRFHNDVTDVGLRDIINTMFRSGSTPALPYEDWYMGLIDNAAFTGLDNSDIMSSHTGWAEFEDYSEGVRQTWTAVLLSNPATFINTAACVFTIDAAGDIEGMFISSDSVVGALGVSGFLWATASFDAAISVLIGDAFRVQYQLTASR